MSFHFGSFVFELLFLALVVAVVVTLVKVNGYVKRRKQADKEMQEKLDELLRLAKDRRSL
ncbi:hypothetical protein J31TS4_25970 [Paenibacillus sp. J31TS4]|uniref:hypothetical protein n=1 Tax=Paenibacillus sp. J31TS4 TaxID=2807195 RepID=UPI001AFE5B9D|nr:hypothetical protein [Paenibacillus sp. J31TS4]GIP39317.1 hypothetical protein J31TS4_25970 [Paenibacillus sp. J31TS4]